MRDNIDSPCYLELTYFKKSQKQTDRSSESKVLGAQKKFPKRPQFYAQNEQQQLLSEREEF